MVVAYHRHPGGDKALLDRLEGLIFGDATFRNHGDVAVQILIELLVHKIFNRFEPVVRKLFDMVIGRIHLDRSRPTLDYIFHVVGFRPLV